MNFLKKISELQEKYSLSKITIELFNEEYIVNVPLSVNRLGSSKCFIDLLTDFNQLDSDFNIQQYPDSVEIVLWKKL